MHENTYNCCDHGRACAGGCFEGRAGPPGPAGAAGPAGAKGDKASRACQVQQATQGPSGLPGPKALKAPKATQDDARPQLAASVAGADGGGIINSNSRCPPNRSTIFFVGLLVR